MKERTIVNNPDLSGAKFVWGMNKIEVPFGGIAVSYSVPKQEVAEDSASIDFVFDKDPDRRFDLANFRYNGRGNLENIRLPVWSLSELIKIRRGWRENGDFHFPGLDIDFKNGNYSQASVSFRDFDYVRVDLGGIKKGKVFRHKMVEPYEFEIDTDGFFLNVSRRNGLFICSELSMSVPRQLDLFEFSLKTCGLKGNWNKIFDDFPVSFKSRRFWDFSKLLSKTF